MTSRPSRKIFMQVLWTGVDGNIPSLYLFTDSKRYMFNCSEGMQRLFTQCRLKIGKLDTFFLTRYQWSHIGGLPGFGMTLRDVKKGTVLQQTAKQAKENELKQANKQDTTTKKKKGKEQKLDNRKTSPNSDSNNSINVHGPQGIRRVMDATRYFMRFDMSGVQFRVNEHGNPRNRNRIPPFKDEEMTIHPIPIYDKNTHVSHNQFYSCEGSIQTINVTPKFSPPFLCYACHVKPIPGHFNKEKAKELGIPNDSSRGKLVKGESITLPDGREIKPEEVVEPQEPGPVFLIVDCPSPSYIMNLKENSMLTDYYKKEKADIVFHLTHETVLDHNDYKEFLNRFPSTVKHVFVNKPDRKRIVFKRQAKMQEQLSQISSTFFPLINDNSQNEFLASDDNNNTIYNFTKINLRESVGKTTGYLDNTSVYRSPENDECPSIVPEEKSENNLDTEFKDVPVNEHGETLLSSGKRKSDGTEDTTATKSCKQEHDYPRVVCLGTGSAIPSKCRNVSSTLVFLSAEDVILFDCGEDTYGQLCRHYKDVDDVIKKIKIILISHMHADHHLGLKTLLHQYERLKSKDHERILVISPMVLSNWLSRYAEVSERLNFEFVDCESINKPTLFKNYFNVHAVPVHHPGKAHAFVLSYGKDMKITYSGDTMPCQQLIDAGMNSHLLIHEATLEDDMIEEAISRKHSTTSQALEVGEKMKAENILLTHFSQRYPRMPILKDELNANAAFAFDHMEITLDNITSFKQYVPKLSELLEGEVEKEEDHEEIKAL